MTDNGLPACQSSGSLQEQGPTTTTTTLDKDSPSQCNPLDNPDILFHLVPLVSRGTATICVQVCQAWRAVFLPRIWSQLSAFASPVSNHPTIDLIQKHASVVLSLKISHPDCSALVGEIDLPNLLDLTIYSSDQTNPSIKDSVSLIQRHHRTLNCLVLCQDATQEFFEALCQCRRLQKLTLVELRPIGPSHWITVYEELWSRLTTLSINAGFWTENPKDEIHDDDDDSDNGDKDDSDGGDQIPPLWDDAALSQLFKTPVPLAKIQDLYLFGQDMDSTMAMQLQLWLIRHSPDLIRLHWDALTMAIDHNPMHLFAQEIRTSGGGWEQLESISFSGSFLVQDFKTLIDRLPRLSALSLRASNFGLAAWLTLKGTGLAQRLRSLKVDSCDDLTGSVIQDMLCSLPSLEVFEGDEIADTDILENDRPWICTKLKELSLTFTPVAKSNQKDIASRIARLNKLQKLDLDQSSLPMYLTDENYDDVTGDLDMLRTLKELRQFRVLECDGVIWNLTEANWVVENWPCLEILEVEMDGDYSDVMQAEQRILWRFS